MELHFASISAARSVRTFRQTGAHSDANSERGTMHASLDDVMDVALPQFSPQEQTGVFLRSYCSHPLLFTVCMLLRMSHAVYHH